MMDFHRFYPIEADLVIFTLNHYFTFTFYFYDKNVLLLLNDKAINIDKSYILDFRGMLIILISF
jgi:hypothetical protein